MPLAFPAAGIVPVGAIMRGEVMLAIASISWAVAGLDPFPGHMAGRAPIRLGADVSALAIVASAGHSLGHRWSIPGLRA